VSISKPQGETTTKFISNFSSYLTDHEWNCIIRAGTPSEVLTEFYRYITSFRDIYRYGIYI
jgi:4'-phosphopantetheinyl transferase